MLAAVLVLAVPATAAPMPTLTETEHALFTAVNAARISRGLPPLRLDPGLTRAARSHSRQLLSEGRLVHGALTERLRRFRAPAATFGENLAWGAGVHGQAAAVVGRWLNSPSHRANLLRPGFRWVGLGAATGTFAGRPGATVVTAVFSGD